MIDFPHKSSLNLFLTFNKQVKSSWISIFQCIFAALFDSQFEFKAPLVKVCWWSSAWKLFSNIFKFLYSLPRLRGLLVSANHRTCSIIFRICIYLRFYEVYNIFCAPLALLSHEKTLSNEFFLQKFLMCISLHSRECSIRRVQLRCRNRCESPAISLQQKKLLLHIFL